MGKNIFQLYNGIYKGIKGMLSTQQIPAVRTASTVGPLKIASLTF